jgi:hypothetical protein
MKSYMLIGVMLASILLTLSFGVALAAEDNMNMPNNSISSMDMPMTDNSTSFMDMPMSMSMPMSMLMAMPANPTKENPNATMNVFILQNVTLNIITMQNVTLLQNSSTA